jgi:hypothetical protein
VAAASPPRRSGVIDGGSAEFTATSAAAISGSTGDAASGSSSGGLSHVNHLRVAGTRLLAATWRFSGCGAAAATPARWSDGASSPPSLAVSTWDSPDPPVSRRLPRACRYDSGDSCPSRRPGRRALRLPARWCDDRPPRARPSGSSQASRFVGARVQHQVLELAGQLA